MEKRFVTLQGKHFELTGTALKVGQKAPDFVLRNPELDTVSLADFSGKKKLISVVPSLDTGVCDQQTRRFNEEINQLSDAVVITVSVDLPFAQARWCGASGLENAITLSDHYDVSFGKAYGVLITDLRLLARSVFVLDKDNKVVYIEYVSEVGEHPDYERALSALKEG